MKIKVNYVGEGDCIIITWENEQKLAGIIDCNSNDVVNSAVDVIESKGIERLRFVILSHPHYDHYSGLPEVLSHCIQESIPIDFFGHPVRLGKKYIKSVVGTKKKKGKLFRLFSLVQEGSDRGIINKRGYIQDTHKNIEISKDVHISFLSPSMEEMEDYLKRVVDGDKIGLENEYANRLSVVSAIVTDSWYALLTSDAKEFVFDRLGTGPLSKVNKNLILGQVPHHGSPKNYSPEFWKRIKNTGQPHHAFISVGPNNHGHPSEDVIDHLRKQNYSVHSTWLSESSERASKVRRLLSSSSTKVGGSSNGRDLTFQAPTGSFKGFELI